MEWRFNKVRTLFVIFLMSSIILHSFIMLAPEKTKVGIVLTDGAGENLASIAMEGFENYSRYFDLTVLDYDLDISNFSTGYEHLDIHGTGTIYSLLTNDFNDPEITRNIRSLYDIEIVMFITEYPVANWVDNPLAGWGEADTESMSCVFSVYGYEDGSEHSNEHIRFIALHEIGHLLGYAHDNDDPDCVMTYSGSNPAFCEKHVLELPYRNLLWPLGAGMEYGNAVLVIQFGIAMTFLPIITCLAIFTQWALKKVKVNIVSNFYAANAGICASMFLILISEYVIWNVLPAIMFGIMLHIFLAACWSFHINKKERC